MGMQYHSKFKLFIGRVYNMPLTTGKLIVSMINPEVFIKTNIDLSLTTHSNGFH